MEPDLRHCLPDRVRAMVGLLSISAPIASIAPLIEDGCGCARQRPCILADACQSIHRAFAGTAPGHA